MGRAYEDMGEPERAIETYQEYLATSPRDSDKVEGRIRRLKRRLEDRGKPQLAVKKKPPPPPPDRKRPPPSELPPPGQKLHDEQLDRLAALLIDKMKAD